MFTKLDLIERIIATTDEKLLEELGNLMKDRAEDEPVLSKAELAEMDKRWAAYKAGKGRSYSRTEFDKLMASTGRKR